MMPAWLGAQAGLSPRTGRSGIRQSVHVISQDQPHMVRLFPTPRPGYTALYLVSSFFCCFAVLLFCCFAVRCCPSHLHLLLRPSFGPPALTPQASLATWHHTTRPTPPALVPQRTPPLLSGSVALTHLLRESQPLDISLTLT
jgi:hypothetical protein